MPPKEWRTIQETLTTLGLKGEMEKHPSATHEIDPVTDSLTAALYLKSQTKQIGNEENGIIVPTKRDWRTLI
jgi:hypothetical protein